MQDKSIEEKTTAVYEKLTARDSRFVGQIWDLMTQS